MRGTSWVGGSEFSAGPAGAKASGRPSPIGLRALVAVVLIAASTVLSAVPSTASTSSLEKGKIIVYRAGERVPDAELTDFGSPESLGGTVLEGDPRLSARIDYAEGDLLAGVFQSTRGKVLITFPFTEHATILNGQAVLTDQWGNSAVLEAGDSYFIRQGSVILWEVRGHRVQKTFFNRREESDSPSPMVVYRARHEVPQSELFDLGSPEALGGTVLAGDPRISARFDFGDGRALAGVFQATRGDVQIRFPFTEHSTVSDGAVTLTDERGDSYRLDPGDTYLVKQESSILWQVNQKHVQKSFFNVVEG